MWYGLYKRNWSVIITDEKYRESSPNAVINIFRVTCMADSAEIGGFYVQAVDRHFSGQNQTALSCMS